MEAAGIYCIITHVGMVRGKTAESENEASCIVTTLALAAVCTGVSVHYL